MGFEPTERLRSDALQAPAFDHSATSPQQMVLYQVLYLFSTHKSRIFNFYGGESGIRTHEAAINHLIDFESIAFDHSAIPPRYDLLFLLFLKKD